MSSRLALEAWQLLFPAIGIGIFAAIFLGVVIRVCRMKRPAVDHLGNLPLADENCSRRADSSPKADAGLRTGSLEFRDLKPGSTGAAPQPLSTNG